MPTTQNFVIGNKTKFFFTILPEDMLDDPKAPTDVNLTVDVPGVGTSVATGATVIPVTALSNPVPAGTPLVFTSGTAPSQVKVTVYTTKSAKKGATEIVVEETTAAIADGATATYTALLLLVGGTSSEKQIQAKDTATVIYGDELGYETGLVTGASWQISYQFNVLPTDLGYYRLSYAASHAVAGARGWLKHESPAPAGYTVGESISGLVDVTDFSVSYPSDGIVTGRLTFKGRSTPTIKNYS